MPAGQNLPEMFDRVFSDRCGSESRGGLKGTSDNAGKIHSKITGFRQIKKPLAGGTGLFKMNESYHKNDKIPKNFSLILPGNFNLSGSDLTGLESSFITREIAELAGLRRASDEQGAELVGRKRKAGFEYSGIAFPYFLPADWTRARQCRLRRDKPDEETDANGKKKITGKYLTAPGAVSCFYFPPNVKPEWLKDVSVPIVITEGEKKTLALGRLASEDSKLSDWHFLPVGLSGVWNFRSGNIGKTTGENGERVNVRGTVPDFHLVEWKGRTVIILFDANVQTNIDVKTARLHLAKVLQEKGAIVYFVDLPQIEECNGIDDIAGGIAREYGAAEAIKQCLELIQTKYRFSDDIQSVLLGGKLKLIVSAADRGKCRVTAKDEQGAPLAVDTFNLGESEKRIKFIKQIGIELTGDEKTEVARELMSLAAISTALFENDKQTTPTGEEAETSFQVLKDGRIIEQIRGGFAMYDPETGQHSTVESVTDTDGITYVPIDDELFQKENGIRLAGKLVEYNTESELIADVEKYLSTYLDLKPLHLKLTALYILFTYIFDSVLELSYLNATGDAGSGKSRFGLAVTLASHRGLSLITPSAASLYRIVDKFKPTLFIDEFNSDTNSDDAAAIIQILNAGFQKTAQIPRQVATPDGKFKTEMFDAFCPKIIGSLKQSQSNAFNSRCIEIQMERTRRNDIPLRLSRKLLNMAGEVRDKLILWRLRNINRDFEAQLDQAEHELKESGIMPRSIQINIPLYALIDDEDLKKEFVQLLQGRDEVLHEEKQRTIDGEIVQALHVILFDVQENGEAQWHISDRPEENELCEHLRIQKIVSMLNSTDDRKDKLKDQLSEKYIGKKIAGLGLISRRILSRRSDYHRKTAILFDTNRLNVIFRNYGLPVPPDFSLDQLDQNSNPNSLNGLEWSNDDLNNESKLTSLDQTKPNHFNNNEKWSNWSNENPGNRGIKQNGNHSDQSKTELIEVDEIF